MTASLIDRAAAILKQWADEETAANAPPPKPPPERIGPEPKRGKRFQCLAFAGGIKHSLLVDGTPQRRPITCGKCHPCLQWRIELKAHRYALGRGEQQTILRVSGMGSPDEARKWATAQGRRAHSRRVTLLRRDEHYLWECVIIYAEPIDRMPSDCHAETRTVLPYEFRALVSLEPIAEGLEGTKRRTCLFTDWPGYDEDEPDYLHSDGFVELGASAMDKEPTELPPWAKVRRSMDLEDAAALNAADWCDVDTIDDYVGPSRLKEDAREWLAGKREWREAYRPMLVLMGEHEKAPEPKCRGCDRVAVSGRGLCIPCDLRAG